MISVFCLETCKVFKFKKKVFKPYYVHDHQIQFKSLKVHVLVLLDDQSESFDESHEIFL